MAIALGPQWDSAWSAPPLEHANIWFVWALLEMHMRDAHDFPKYPYYQRAPPGLRHPFTSCYSFQKYKLAEGG